MVMNNIEVKAKCGKEENFSRIGKGRRMTISISNTKNRTANRKNRREKGSRALDTGSNPHSKGEDFSRLISCRVLIVVNIISSRVGISRAIRR